MNILLAIDGSLCSESALEEIIHRPWPTGSKLRIVSIVELPRLPGKEPWVLPPGYFEQLANAATDRTRAMVNRAIARVRNEHGPRLEVVGETLLEGDPKELILQVAEQWGADLIVLGSHGLHGWKRFWLGSVSQAVAANAPCSVEIVRCRPLSGDREQSDERFLTGERK